MTPKRNEEPTPSEWKVLTIIGEREPCLSCDVVAEASAAFRCSRSAIVGGT